MAKRILVPLDHTTDHGAIIPLVADAARGSGATVRLLHVAPVPVNALDSDGRVLAYVDQEMSRLEGEWRDSLPALEAMLAGMTVESVVRFGHPADEILAEAEAFEADLIAVTTSCPSGVKRALLGSVAEQVVRRARPSVLLLRPALA
jgi:nucleotide-binding universal stress UspA family protein